MVECGGNVGDDTCVTHHYIRSIERLALQDRKTPLRGHSFFSHFPLCNAFVILLST